MGYHVQHRCAVGTHDSCVIAEGDGFCRKHPGEMSICDKVGARRQDSCMKDERTNTLAVPKLVRVKTSV